MAVKLTLLAAFIASMISSSIAQRVCPSGYSPMCCMSGISPWYNSAGSFGGLCGFYPDDTSLPCAGRCSWTDGDWLVASIQYSIVNSEICSQQRIECGMLP
jgi:hypothetical protein